ncbi:Aminopeptidase N [Auxenochlorella protothecoides]|uniref:Aminopeptidase N n=1 Tax=Auxenochlorella protothecoides TaxID=3075 RepID=A0A087SBE9_AUXPR|nr:Aminopeptidase N [Auxenochlorella protothecoides]KFM23053.1 Aminopeptidase N [Auxenochlorella protothecoides]
MAATDKPVEKFRKDYKPSPYLISTVHLDFQLNEESTLVQSKLRIVPNHAESSPVSLFLNGHADVVLESIRVNGADLEASHYAADAQGLTIKSGLPSGEWDLEIATRIKPQENTSLEGLYRSGGMFCSQCEAEGFRHITYFLDRPDVMAKYTSRIEADKAKYPVLLSNGNLVDQGDLEGGRHFTVWEDPFVKPCYLFALVAGDLAVQEDTFRTMSGKDVALRIYTDAHNTSKVAFAMQSLKRAMKWDEETFGLEYDLDLFNIVAVDDFNMGAMENKSLNLFNSRLVLATPDTATDADFGRIEGVVGHEYFHNWTGNRVTCRDWFQLTLKEGLTVYRDQEFSADLNSRGVKRVEDVARLRAAQFPEDAGPLAHAIRPDSVIKMDNFYTATVYEKGAEVVRLYEALLGRAGFRAGLDLYFARHDGGAVTCDDFRAAMADASGADLGGLEGWYARAGTPRVEVGVEHDAGAGTLTVTATQAPPVLTAREGGVTTAGQAMLRQAVLRLEHQRQTWVFERVPARPVPSVLRGFSAPVRLTFKAHALALPDLAELVPEVPGADPLLLHHVREAAARALAAALRPELERAARDNSDPPGAPYEFEAGACARRALKNAALGALARLGGEGVTQDLLARFRAATNMTDEAAALAALDRIGGKVRQEALDAFYAKWKHEPLVLLKWIAMQAASNLPGNTAAVRTLMQHEAVKLSNPNTCYSLFLAFARSPVNFHAADGSGYEFMADSVLQIDQINHQVAARMVGVFNSWRNYDAERGALMTAALRRMASANGISANVYEIVTKALP